MLYLSLLCSPVSVRVLVDTVMHFPPSLEEVTVSVNDERMWVRNHVEKHGTLVFFNQHWQDYIRYNLNLLTHELVEIALEPFTHRVFCCFLCSLLRPGQGHAD